MLPASYFTMRLAFRLLAASYAERMVFLVPAASYLSKRVVVSAIAIAPSTHRIRTAFRQVRAY